MRDVDASSTEFLESRLQAIRLASLFVTTRVRNAWHRTEVRHYQGTGSLSVSLDGAKDVAERWRARGSSFVILEVPALILVGDHVKVAKVDFHRSDSFSHWIAEDKSLLQRGAPLADLSEALTIWGSWKGALPDANSLISGLIEDQDQLLPIRLSSPFHKWSSYPDGQYYRLGYYKHESDYVAAGCKKIRDSFYSANRARR